MEIKLVNLAKTFETDKHGHEIHAVQNISLTIPSNKIFGIIGKSGAGKSTLVRLVSLLEKPDSGQVYYNHERVDNLTGSALIQRRRRIGMIFQSFDLFSSRTAGQNIAYPLEICGTPKKEIDKRVHELLALVDLADRCNAPISTLSGGQKQRIAIARALANNPDILFCDEATSALDPQTTESILNLIRKIQEQMNLTVVMITHQMEVVRDACSLVAVVDDGRIVEQGAVQDIFLHPQNPVTKDFLLNLVPEKSHKQNSDMVRWSECGGKYTLRFKDTLTDEPVLSRMAHQFNVEFNIRAGGIQKLPNNRVGTLITDISGTSEEVTKAIAYLQSNGVLVEEERTSR
ncbi:MAG: methionine ABC transporter ATP-binding protein [Treponema sp.]|nr:methionine ABC transporter ATP-binding protein [Treponema sp.]